MKIIAVVGDSHTWGQGAGAEYHMDPPFCCADLRPLSFGFPTYVNLLRDAVGLATGARWQEYEGDELFRLFHGSSDGGYAVLGNKPFTYQWNFDFARIFFRPESESAEVTVTVDGEITDVITLQSDAPFTDRAITHCHLFPRGEGDHEVTLTLTGGKRALIYRVELYSGEYAVVNCGVGARTVGMYLDNYFDRYVSPLKPHLVLFEGCTINNWLSTSTTEAYAEELHRMAKRLDQLTSRQLWHTVFPVWGEQMNQWGRPYVDYVDTMREVAKEQNIPLADCFAYMEKELSRTSEEHRSPLLYADNWHPNGTGYYMYARTIFPYLQKMM